MVRRTRSRDRAVRSERTEYGIIEARAPTKLERHPSEVERRLDPSAASAFGWVSCPMNASKDVRAQSAKSTRFYLMTKRGGRGGRSLACYCVGGARLQKGRGRMDGRPSSTTIPGPVRPVENATSREPDCKIDASTSAPHSLTPPDHLSSPRATNDDAHQRPP